MIGSQRDVLWWWHSVWLQPCAFLCCYMSCKWTCVSQIKLVFVLWVVVKEKHSVHRTPGMIGTRKCSFSMWMEQWLIWDTAGIKWRVGSVYDVSVCAEIPRGRRNGGRLRFCVWHQVLEPPHLKPRESISNRIMCTIDVFEWNRKMVYGCKEK